LRLHARAYALEVGVALGAQLNTTGGGVYGKVLYRCRHLCFDIGWRAHGAVNTIKWARPYGFSNGLLAYKMS
jgi:hypothetical protein